jgi:hypothetical protein
VVFIHEERQASNDVPRSAVEGLASTDMIADRDFENLTRARIAAAC